MKVLYLLVGLVVLTAFFGACNIQSSYEKAMSNPSKNSLAWALNELDRQNGKGN